MSELPSCFASRKFNLIIVTYPFPLGRNMQNLFRLATGQWQLVKQTGVHDETSQIPFQLGCFAASFAINAAEDSGEAGSPLPRVQHSHFIRHKKSPLYRSPGILSELRVSEMELILGSLSKIGTLYDNKQLIEFPEGPGK